MYSKALISDTWDPSEGPSSKRRSRNLLIYCKHGLFYPANDITGSHMQDPAHNNLVLSYDLLSFEFTCQIASVPELVLFPYEQ